MFIRKRTHNTSLAGFLLVVFLLTSAFGPSSGLLTSYVKSLRSGVQKSKSTKPPAGQIPYEKTEKEEKGLEEKSGFISLQIEATLFNQRESDRHSFHTSAECVANTANIPLYILIRTLLI